MVNWQLASILPVWLLSLVAAVLLTVLIPGDEVHTWFAIVLAASIIFAFLIQLGIRRKEGFVMRVSASVAGAVVVLGACTVVALVIA